MIRKIIIVISILSFTKAVYSKQNAESQDTSKLTEQRIESLENEIKLQQQFKISGYIQTQLQCGEKDALLKVGSGNTDKSNNYNRFGIRRGRIKMEYEKSKITGNFQIDITEGGIALKDAYLSIKDPIIGISSLRAGVFNRPFGYEISYSSSKRESPERSTIITTLFPDERDLGAMITLQAPKSSPWNSIKLDAALVAGNGIKIDMDNYKDFIGHLSANFNFDKVLNISGGISYYYGNVYQGTSSLFIMENKSFIEYNDTANYGAFSKREYYGIDAQCEWYSPIGISQLYGEYIYGTQPGNKNSSKSPNYSTLPTSNTYIRDFAGYYISFVQNLGTLPISLIVKYDYYDPNIQIANSEIGLNGTGKADIAYNTIGCGLMWKWDTIRLTAYYDWITNETSTNLSDYNFDLHDNLLTIRLQYKY